MSPDFLDVEDVLELHARLIERYGGLDGLRDPGLLESAVAQPQATFGGQYVHESIVEMAAAYLFHLVANHPFVDGNKRVGLLAALVFLETNGYVADSPTEEFYELTMAVADGRLGKLEVIAWLARLVHEDAST